MADHTTPAFPTGIITDDKGMIVGGSNGMTLRDYFAAKAMQPLIVSFTIQDINWTAEQAYKIADSMLKAREA